jgi:hypothetical protein
MIIYTKGFIYLILLALEVIVPLAQEFRVVSDIRYVRILIIEIMDRNSHRV